MMRPHGIQSKLHLKSTLTWEGYPCDLIFDRYDNLRLFHGGYSCPILFQAVAMAVATAVLTAVATAVATAVSTAVATALQVYVKIVFVFLYSKSHRS